MNIQTPRWAVPLLSKARYKGAHGGRGGGKSHFFAEMLVEEHLMNPNRKTVCIREIQKSLRHSVKALIESKIEALGIAKHFEVQRDLILSKRGSGMMVFQGMQDHTAESIKSLEGFDCAWIEEAQSISKRSLSLLRPTIRKAGSEIWATWNPNFDTDPIDQLLRGTAAVNDAVVVEVNLRDNPFASAETWREYHDDLARAKKKSALGDKNALSEFEHIWHGAYRQMHGVQVLAGCYESYPFELSTLYQQAQQEGITLHWLYGADWGFATDPTVLIQCALLGRTLYIVNEAYGKQIETVQLPDLFRRIPESQSALIRGDSARPEIISHLRKHGFSGIRAAEKWAGSVQDGVSFLRGLDNIVIHPRCVETVKEALLWSYKTDRLTGEPLPELIDAHNHCFDAIRYSLEPFIKQKTQSALPQHAPRRWA